MSSSSSSLLLATSLAKPFLSSIESLGPPERTYLIGMAHDLPHVATNEKLKCLPPERFGVVELAFDGMVLEVDL